MKQFLFGFRYAFTGFSLIGHKGLRWYMAMPLLLSLLFVGLAIWFGYQQLGNVTESIKGFLPGFLSWLSPVLVTIIAPLFLIVCFYISALAANIVASPFNGILAERVETILMGYPPPSNGRLIKKLQMLFHLIISELRKLAYIALFSLPLIILSFVPVVNIVMPAVWLIAGSWLLCLEYMDYPMGNHNIRFTQQRSLLRQHKNVALGYGLGTLIITSIPVLNLLAMPAAACSATKLWVDYFSRYYKD